MPAMTLPTSRASPSSASPRISGVNPGAAGHGGGGLERQLRRGDHDGLDAAQAADRRASASRRGPRLRWARTGGRRLDAVAGEDRARVGEGRRIGDGRPGGDHRRIVAGHVGDRAG